MWARAKSKNGRHGAIVELEISDMEKLQLQANELHTCNEMVTLRTGFEQKHVALGLCACFVFFSCLPSPEGLNVISVRFDMIIIHAGGW